jgi:DGQHR domain-containing protein
MLSKKSVKIASKKAAAKKAAAKKALPIGSLTEKKTGKLVAPLSTFALQVEQGTHRLFLFKEKASLLFSALSINRKVEDKDEGYQRVLSSSRVQALKRFIAGKNAVPGAIVVCLDEAEYVPSTKTLTIKAGDDVGWIVDGQHRLASAALAAREGVDIELSVVAFVGLSSERQIEQFITINKEAKSVPSSLYLDLLKRLPNKRSADAPKERAADLATLLRKNEDSPFFQRIVTTTAPKEGQISLVNFVRKVAPLVVPEKGLLSPHPEIDQVRILANYYKGLAQVFPDEFENSKSVFFKTLGFGALMNVFPSFFTLTLKECQGSFRVSDVASTFQKIDSYNFDAWKQAGTGSQGEIFAGDDLKTSLAWAFRDDTGTGSSIKLS